MELSLTELGTIEKALRILRDRHYRHPSESSYDKQRAIFDSIEELRCKVMTHQSEQRNLWLNELTELMKES